MVSISLSILALAHMSPVFNLCHADADTFQRNVEALGVDLKRLDARCYLAPAWRPYEWP